MESGEPAQHAESRAPEAREWPTPQTVTIGKLTVPVRSEEEYVRALIASKIDYWADRIRSQLSLLGAVSCVLLVSVYRPCWLCRPCRVVTGVPVGLIGLVGLFGFLAF